MKGSGVTPTHTGHSRALHTFALFASEQVVSVIYAGFYFKGG